MYKIWSWIITKILSFLEEIGIPFQPSSISETTFLPGLKIESGQLIYDPERLLYPGDLLHEAGHLAVIPASDRPLLSDQVVITNQSKDGDEIAAMLWSYAAALHIGLPPEVVFHPNGYKGEHDWILSNYRSGSFIGLPLFKWMGFCEDDFPTMKQWLRS